MTYVLYAAAAVVGVNTQHEVARSDDRADLEAKKHELDVADEARHYYSTARWIERIDD